MTYTKHTWNAGKAGGTPITAVKLNQMEDGIAAAATTAGVAADVANPESTIGSALSDTIVAGVKTAPRPDETAAAFARGRALRSTLAAVQSAGVSGLTVGTLVPYGTTSGIAVQIDPAASLTVAGPHYVTTASPHGLSVNDVVGFSTITGATGVTAGLAFYVYAVISTTQFQIKANLTDTFRKQWPIDGTGSLYHWPVTESAWDKTAGAPNTHLAYTGARPVQTSSSGPARDYAMADPTSLTYAPGTLTGPSLIVQTTSTGTKIDAILINNPGYPTRVYVDDVLVKTLTVADFTAAGVSNTSPGRLPLVFATAANHTVRIEVMQGSIGGFDRPQTNPVMLPLIPSSPFIMFVGDSYGEGGSAGDTGIPFVTWMERLMGWPNVWRSCSGSTGYLTDGTRTALIDRWQNDIVAQAPENLVLALGINDATQTPEQIATAAATIIDGVVAALPSIKITVVGPFSPKGVGYIAGYLPLMDVALKAVADARGLKYISPIAEGWITGNGNTASPNGSGNSDVFITTDGTHPLRQVTNISGGVSPAIWRSNRNITPQIVAVGNPELTRGRTRRFPYKFPTNPRFGNPSTSATQCFLGGATGIRTPDLLIANGIQAPIDFRVISGFWPPVPVKLWDAS